MIRKLALILPILLCVARPAWAHSLDEYVQATVISLAADHIDVSMRLTPGAAVFAEVMTNIDTDANGVISTSEGHRYADRVLSELSLSIDGRSLDPRVVSVGFPATDLLREGMDAIRIELTARLPDGGSKRRLVLKNHHLSRISAYLVNCSVPRDPRLAVQAQHRSGNQASYRLDYVQSGLIPAGR